MLLCVGVGAGVGVHCVCGVWCGAAWHTDPLLPPSVCRFKTPPCVRSRRLRVYWQENTRMCFSVQPDLMLSFCGRWSLCISLWICTSFQRGDQCEGSKRLTVRLFLDDFQHHGDHSLVDVLCPQYLFLPSLVQENPDSVILIESSSAQKYVSTTRLPKFCFRWSPCFTQKNRVPSASLNLFQEFIDSLAAVQRPYILLNHVEVQERVRDQLCLALDFFYVMFHREFHDTFFRGHAVAIARVDIWSSFFVGCCL